MSQSVTKVMPVIDFMQTRRSVPAKMMGGPGPDKNEIRQMAEIAARVPDHGKIAPWRFVEYSQAAKLRLDGLIFSRAVEKQPDLAGELYAIEQTRMQRSNCHWLDFCSQGSSQGADLGAGAILWCGWYELVDCGQCIWL